MPNIAPDQMAASNNERLAQHEAEIGARFPGLSGKLWRLGRKVRRWEEKRSPGGIYGCIALASFAGVIFTPVVAWSLLPFLTVGILLSARAQKRIRQVAQEKLKEEGVSLLQPVTRRSFSKTARWLTSALFLPVDLPLKMNWRKLAVFTTAWCAIHPAAILLFPTAGEALKKEGLDPALAEQLAPRKHVRVRSGVWGNLHAVFERGPYLVYDRYNYFFRSSLGGSTTSSMWSTIPGVCDAWVSNDKGMETFERTLRKAFNKGAEYRLTVSQKLSDQLTLMHEIRHCSDENKNTPSDLLQEGDAHYHALLAFNDPAVAASVIDMEAAFQRSAIHDMALYLDARFNGAAVPSVGDIEQANVQANPIIETMLDQEVKLGFEIQKGVRKECSVSQPCTIIVNAEALSLLARRKLELAARNFNEGLKAPGLIKIEPSSLGAT